MRQRRTLLGHEPGRSSATAVGLTFQQIQKYERGSNRIGSSRLYEFAKVLDVPVSYFFDEMPSNALSGRPMSGRGRKGFGEAGTPFEQEKDPLIKRETLELVRAYYKIREGRVRKRIFEMVKAVGAASHAEVLGGRKQRKPCTRRAKLGRGGPLNAGPCPASPHSYFSAASAQTDNDTVVRPARQSLASRSSMAIP